MTIEGALGTASAKPAGRRPYFLTPEVERVMAIAMAIAQELAVARTRIDTLERLLERKGLLDRAEFERFAPNPDEAIERGLWTQEYISRILRIVQQEAERANEEPGGDLASEDVAVEIARNDPSSSR